jgi:hypothetical protein
LREHRLRPDREAHLGQIAHIADAGVYDQPLAAARLRRGGEQIAEIAVLAGAGRCDDEDVAGLQLLDGDMDHPVVARRRGDRHGGAGDARAGVDRPHITRQKPGAPLCLMHGRHPAALESGDDGGIGPHVVLDDNTAHPRSSGKWTGDPCAAIPRSANAKLADGIIYC